MQTKMMTVTEMSETGKGLAILARLSEIDHDGDTYAKGAFGWKGDQWCPLIHHHDRYQMPFGKARVYEESDIAYAELHLNLETQAGKDWHKALLFDLATGKAVQEYSYGFDVIDADFQVRGDNRVRILKQLDVHEVSTVIRGAGRGTGTLSMKALEAKEQTELARALNARIDQQAGNDDDERSAIIDRMASAAGIERGTVLQILRGDIETPPEERIRGFARVLDIPVARLEALLERGDDDAAKAAIANEIARHLTREARLKFRP
ncbi:MAG: HK97 family phage prohead protease [Erythrobacter sp.]|jgi:HK97 family phage prohead protease